MSIWHISDAGPHPLDGLWAIAIEKVGETQAAIDNCPKDIADDDVDALADAHLEALGALWALPSRNLEDVFLKLKLGGSFDLDGFLSTCPALDILKEADVFLEEARRSTMEAAPCNPR